MNERRPDRRTEILAMIRSDAPDTALQEGLCRYHDNDIASVLTELTRPERVRLLCILGNSAMSEIVSYLEDASDYLGELDTDSAADIIEQMDADEALDALEDLDEKTQQEILHLIEEDEVKAEIELLRSYGEQEFGSQMSTNYIAIPRTLSVKAAMRSLISEAAEKDNISTIFVTDGDGVFYGAIELKALIIARSDDELQDLICTTFPYVYDTDSIPSNLERLRSYSEDLIPVLSSEGGKLLGVITSRDITELVDEELEDDYAKLAALGAEEERNEPLLRSMRKRIPWLIVLLLMGLGVSAVVGLFEGIVDELPMIVAFQSLILGMAGNVGTQSLAVTVRGIGTDEDRRAIGRLQIIGRETRIAALNGLALGLISFLIVGGYLLLVGGYAPHFALAAALCVGSAMCFAMTVSGMTGAAIPLGLQLFGVDPAVASGPLITTVNDLVAVVSYYGLAWAFLLRLGA